MQAYRYLICVTVILVVFVMHASGHAQDQPTAAPAQGLETSQAPTVPPRPAPESLSDFGGSVRALVLEQWRESDKTSEASLVKGDHLLAVDGEVMAGNDDLMRAIFRRASGETVRILAERRYDSDSPLAGTELVEREYRIPGSLPRYAAMRIGGREQYRSPAQIHPEWQAHNPDELEREVRKGFAAAGAEGGLADLERCMDRNTWAVPGFFRNDEVYYLLNRPFDCERWGRALWAELSADNDTGRLLCALAAKADPQGITIGALNEPLLPPALVPPSGASALDLAQHWIGVLVTQLDRIDQAYREAESPLTPQERLRLRQWALDFAPMRARWFDWSEEESKAFYESFQLVKKLRMDQLREAMRLSAELASWLCARGPLHRQFLVLAAPEQPVEFEPGVIFGGMGDDVYDKPARVIVDVHGNDRYGWGPVSEEDWASTLIFDAEGDDRYVAKLNFAGAGILASGMLIDGWGDDLYEVEQGGMGFGLMGLGLLLDEQGQDSYRGKQHVQGVGCVGVGLLMDCGGNDGYGAAMFSQGVGLPGGCGAIIETGGDDLYTCTGHVESNYGTVGEFSGFCQGIGFGFRGQAAGGIGVLLDRAGRDVYNAGEFGIGHGYFYGLGIACDLRGDDVYRCCRYGCGSSAHLGVGIALDEQGDDCYRALSAAVFGGTWDLSVGVLIDSAGDDSYTAVGDNSLGWAAQNGWGLFWDKQGNDLYAGAHEAGALGFAGGSEYGAGRLARNVAVFLDSEGADVYRVPDRRNDASGMEREYGLWVDK